LIGRRDLSLAPDLRTGLEMVLLRMLSFRPATAGKVAVAAASTTPAQAAQTGTKQPVSAPLSNASPPVSPPPKVAEPPPPTSPAPARQAAAQPAAVNRDSRDWREILQGLPISGMVKQLAANCVLCEVTDKIVQLSVGEGHKQLCNVKSEKRLQQALCEYFDRDLRLEIIVAKAAPAVAESVDGRVETPAQSQARETDERQRRAENSVEEDGFVQALKESFNAEIVPGSVKPVS
jgi:DNA polymerase-3 subunit gamma/tau